jgi:hypothetical protein
MRSVKALSVTALGLALAFAVSASAQTNDAIFKQTQGDDGRWHYEISAGYAFPGLPPRTGNFGVGTLRVTLPGTSFTLESTDPQYQCSVEGPGQIVCSNEGLAIDGGTAFPSSMTLRLLAPACWTPPDGQAGSADIWAAPYDPGTAPDVRLPLQPGECATDPSTQPVLDTKDSCKVSNVKGMTVAAAARELAAGDCKRGRVSYAYSPKVKKGRVIKQSQRPGKTLKAGSKVNLVVSKGKRR